MPFKIKISAHENKGQRTDAMNRLEVMCTLTPRLEWAKPDLYLISNGNGHGGMQEYASS